ncbi:MAG: hypothetical protein ACLU3U_07580 [Gallintestinimicrobium sp.]
MSCRFPIIIKRASFLLQEIPNGGALFLKARRFQSLPGDSFS